MHDDAILTLGSFDVPRLRRCEVRVYAPVARPQATPRPVLYMFEGQNVFDDGPSFDGGWHLQRTTAELARVGRRAPVIVAIHHGEHTRTDDLSPFSGDIHVGKLDALVDWIADTLVPRITTTLDVAPGPEDVGIGGSSMGGLAALYAHFRSPERFGLVLAMSPSLWFGGGRIASYVASRPTPRTSRIHIDCGLHESTATFGAARRMVTLLRARGYGESALRWVASATGRHHETSWRARAPEAIDFLFDTTQT